MNKSLEEWHQALVSFINEFKAESDRAAVILGVAKLDVLLYQLIAKVMLPGFVCDR